MAEPYLSEIRIFGFNFAPRGWAQCNGQLLPINQNQTLYALLGTTYGGDGRTSFALPDLRSRVPMHVGGDTYAVSLGQKGGAEAIALSVSEIPAHTHSLQASTAAGNASSPENNVFAEPTFNLYGAASNLDTMNTATVANNAGGAAHDNIMPILAVNFCIALQGLFPPRN